MERLAQLPGVTAAGAVIEPSLDRRRRQRPVRHRRPPRTRQPEMHAHYSLGLARITCVPSACPCWPAAGSPPPTISTHPRSCWSTRPWPCNIGPPWKPASDSASIPGAIPPSTPDDAHDHRRRNRRREGQLPPTRRRRQRSTRPSSRTPASATTWPCARPPMPQALIPPSASWRRRWATISASRKFAPWNRSWPHAWRPQRFALQVIGLFAIVALVLGADRHLRRDVIRRQPPRARDRDPLATRRPTRRYSPAPAGQVLNSIISARPCASPVPKRTRAENAGDVRGVILLERAPSAARRDPPATSGRTCPTTSALASSRPE